MVTRRQLLGTLGVVPAAALLGGCSLPDLPAPPRRERARCVPVGQMQQQSRIGGARLVYEVTGSAQPFPFDSAFYRQLNAWYADWTDTVPWAKGDRLDSYGAWNGRDCSSWHASGRAFDLARVRSSGETVVSCREDLWSGQSAAQLAWHRRRYWALAAHLHIHFAYVLSYLFDDLHRNHLHIDNGRSGPELSQFRSGSRVQVQAVQATARYLFDEPVELTGRWDAPTQRAAEAVLRTLGRRGGMTGSDNWHAYLRAAARRG